MKKSHLVFNILFFVGYLSLDSTSQKITGTKERVAEIKKWYAEIQSIGLRNCKSKKFIKYDNPFNQNENIPFNQTVSICQLNNVYLIKKGQFEGHEWAEDVLIYYKNGLIFFVFIKGVSEGYTYERRYYLNSREKIIQELEREADYGEEFKGNHKEVSDNLNKDIREIIDLDVFKIVSK